MALLGHRLHTLDHRIDLGLVLRLVECGRQVLFTGRRAGSAVLHQGIQGAEGLLEALTDTAIGPLEVQTQGLGCLAKGGGDLCRRFPGHGIDFIHVIAGLLGLGTDLLDGGGPLSPAAGGLVVMDLALGHGPVHVFHAGDRDP
ncbi:hypothetical protein D3C73_1025070 [compost metagenome]